VEAAQLDAQAPDVRFLGARLAAAEGHAAQAVAELSTLAQSGHDGYAVQMAIAELTDPKTQLNAARAALSKAHEHDPTQAEPLQALQQLSEQTGDTAAEILVLKQLARLEGHDASVYRRLLTLLVGRKAYAQAVEVGQAAIYVDLEGARTHSLYAQALAGAGRFGDAAFEFESAIRCPSRPPELAEAHVGYAEFLAGRGQAARAEAELARARALDPEHPRFKPAAPAP
jgi:tetratricopeptide (TPR) repeat protein